MASDGEDPFKNINDPNNTDRLNSLLEFRPIDFEPGPGLGWRVRELEKAIATFLDAEGNDLCHENREELAKVIGRPYKKPSTVCRQEFAENCLIYQQKTYGSDQPAIGESHYSRLLRAGFHPRSRCNDQLCGFRKDDCRNCLPDEVFTKTPESNLDLVS